MLYRVRPRRAARIGRASVVASRSYPHFDDHYAYRFTVVIVTALRPRRTVCGRVARPRLARVRRVLAEPRLNSALSVQRLDPRQQHLDLPLQSGDAIGGVGRHTFLRSRSDLAVDPLHAARRSALPRTTDQRVHERSAPARTSRLRLIHTSRGGHGNQPSAGCLEHKATTRESRTLPRLALARRPRACRALLERNRKPLAQASITGQVSHAF